MNRNTPLKRTPFPRTANGSLGRRLVVIKPEGADVVPIRRDRELDEAINALRAYAAQGQSLQRSGPIAPVSRKRRAENRERRAMAEARFPGMNPRCAVPWCTRPADALHEILSRARGGSITDPENTVPACNICNEELTREPEWGYRLGLVKHSGRCCQGRTVCAKYADSAEPVLIFGGQVQVWLLPGGQISYEPPGGAA